MRAIDGHLNHPKNRLMMWIIELIQLLILAIDRKCILREVVGADAEEIDELCQLLTWHIPVAILGTVFVFSGIMYLVNPEIYVSPVVQLLSGGLMLGAVFMATDYVTSPMSHKGMLIYGVCIGLLTVVIRLFGAYPEGMSFAILIMNAFTPLINTYVKPKRFGEVAKKK